MILDYLGRLHVAVRVLIKEMEKSWSHRRRWGDGSRDQSDPIAGRGPQPKEREQPSEAGKSGRRFSPRASGRNIALLTT